jgi:hypothetical protein
MPSITPCATPRVLSPPALHHPLPHAPPPLHHMAPSRIPMDTTRQDETDACGHDETDACA